MVQGYIQKLNLRSRINAFTIIELLVVIGIIGVLAITLLALLNPAEAQRRSRDAKRLRDANTLQAIVSQYLEDGNTFGSVCTGSPDGGVTPGTPCTSTAASGDTATCANVVGNWLGGVNADLCSYAQAIPVDPVNGAATCVTAANTTAACSSVVYRVAVVGRSYEINVRQESINNDTRTTGDTGNSTGWVEIYSGVNTLMTN
jgi:prepilin-type N-terminal cleavage/methylation domain-containing protein